MPGAPYVNAIVVLYLLTFLLGGIIYAEYRIEVRTVVEQLGLWAQNGSFELKEHFAAVGLGDTACLLVLLAAAGYRGAPAPATS